MEVVKRTKLVDLTVVESQKSQLKRTSSRGRRALLLLSSPSLACVESQVKSKLYSNGVGGKCAKINREKSGVGREKMLQA